ncbi:MAG: preprotein translocase subunit SecG [Woeseia sp.]
MDKIQPIIVIGHTVIAVLIIAFVLLQRGKGADAGAAFGAGASGTVFGARGSSSFFSRVTAILAVLFFASSLTLAYISSQRSTGPESLLEDAAPIEAEQASELTGTDESSDVGELPDLPEPESAADEDKDDLPPLQPDEQ